MVRLDVLHPLDNWEVLLDRKINIQRKGFHYYLQCIFYLKV
jgi:hypothetical protein